MSPALVIQLLHEAFASCPLTRPHSGHRGKVGSKACLINFQSIHIVVKCFRMQAPLAQQQGCRRPTGQHSATARQQRSAVHRPSRCCSTLREQSALPETAQQQSYMPAQQLKSLQLQPQQHSSSDGSTSSSSRRGMLGMLGAAAAAVVLSSVSVEPAVAAAAVSSSSALEEYMKLEDAGKLRDQRSLENIRCAGLATSGCILHLTAAKHTNCSSKNHLYFDCLMIAEDSFSCP